MNGRPSKTTVDYFPHYTMSGKTLFTLESLYGNDGYAFWFKVLEILGSSEGHVFRYENISDWLYLVAKTKVTEEKATNILQTLSDLGAIDKGLHQEKAIWSDNFVVGLAPVYSKRSTEIPKKPSLRGENKPNNIVSGEKTPQSKVEESKVETDIGNKDKTPNCPHQEIVSLYNKILSSKLPAVKPNLWNGTRKLNLSSRWKEDKDRQNIEWWKNYFNTVADSDFLTGKNERKWFADMGWLVKQDSMIKVLEGKFSRTESTDQWGRKI